MAFVGEGKPAVERYLAFVGASGSDYPLNELARVGVDMSSPAPIEAAPNVFGERLEQLGKILP